MNLIIYKNQSAKNVMDKSLSDSITFTNATMRNELNILEPEFLIEENSNLSEYNYCYCDYTGRYYFCEVTEDVTGFWMLKCKVDPLMTFKAGIRACTGTINRNANIANGYLMDPNYIAKSYKKIVTKAFPTSINQDSIILMTVGSEVS